MTETLLSIVILATPGEYSVQSLLTKSLEHSSIHYFCFCSKLQTMSVQAEWQVSMRCGKGDIRPWISVNFAGVKNSKSISTKSLIDRCENVINFEVVSKNTIKRDSSLNAYRQRKIRFEDRVVVEGSKTSINQYGAGPRHPKTGHVDNFRNGRN